MFRGIRRWSGAILLALQELVEAVRSGPGEELANIHSRLLELEARQARWEAEVEGVLLKAQQERQVARNAEERTRHMVRSRGAAEGDDESEEGVVEETLQLLRGGDGAARSEEGVPLVHTRMGLSREDRRQKARLLKFSR